MNLRREEIDIQGYATLFSFIIEYCFLEMFKVPVSLTHFQLAITIHYSLFTAFCPPIAKINPSAIPNKAANNTLNSGGSKKVIV